VPVDVLEVHSGHFPVVIDSYGTVEAVRETHLQPQVSGRIVWVSPQFENGGYIDADAPIVRIDDADYRIAVQTADARVAEARAKLAEQTALSEQAIKDWQRLQRTSPPSDLLARKPQLAAARAELNAALAQQKQAELNLARTVIRAPYAGRIRARLVSVGQYVAPGATLGDFFAIDTVQVPLPLAPSALGWLDIPEGDRPGSAVAFIAEGGQHWSGYIHRSQGVIDPQTRQVFVTARIDAPYTAGETSLHLGEFVNARIQGRVLEQVFVLPSASVLSDDRVIVIEEGRLRANEVEIVWQDAAVSVVSHGLHSGDLVVTAPMGDNFEGLAVSIGHRTTATPLSEQVISPTPLRGSDT